MHLKLLKSKSKLILHYFQTTYLAVLMGLGSKLPCASTDACFCSVAPGLASTKSGGKAPAMAHMHDLAILKSSASYFYRRDKPKGWIINRRLLGLFDKDKKGQAESEKDEEKWRTGSWRNQHQATSCQSVINDSAVLASA